MFINDFYASAAASAFAAIVVLLLPPAGWMAGVYVARTGASPRTPLEGDLAKDSVSLFPYCLRALLAGASEQALHMKHVQAGAGVSSRSRAGGGSPKWVGRPYASSSLFLFLFLLFIIIVVVLVLLLLLWLAAYSLRYWLLFCNECRTNWMYTTSTTAQF